MSRFELDVELFNQTYKLAPIPRNKTAAIERLAIFKNMLTEELDELEEIFELLEKDAPPIAVLVALADLLGDLQVYCASEMLRWGIPVDATLDIIMQSNKSKLDANGNPIYREDGKVMKGPNYWRPEPKIQEMLLARLSR